MNEISYDYITFLVDCAQGRDACVVTLLLGAANGHLTCVKDGIGCIAMHLRHADELLNAAIGFASK